MKRASSRDTRNVSVAPLYVNSTYLHATDLSDLADYVGVAPIEHAIEFLRSRFIEVNHTPRKHQLVNGESGGGR
jgi:hypothetical protein